MIGCVGMSVSERDRWACDPINSGDGCAGFLRLFCGVPPRVKLPTHASPKPLFVRPPHYLCGRPKRAKAPARTGSVVALVNVFGPVLEVRTGSPSAVCRIMCPASPWDSSTSSRTCFGLGPPAAQAALAAGFPTAGTAASVGIATSPMRKCSTTPRVRSNKRRSHSNSHGRNNRRRKPLGHNSNSRPRRADRSRFSSTPAPSRP